ncbi:DUF2721 domain-containing protein [Dictyobacter aurantiacus]|uniref:DUF2721 domain-containing protein n=1 Tax=Dictyobacter aurantiacus TaxID=1936993 RepID=A0A401Z7T7_9CHLR|nr:DUF2721 domain-containing protein [Dictyobacter aurantiacus]GCE02930.1 hypothetical protein KDAU_02590 [Dictyobacter aurantiacus]
MNNIQNVISLILAPVVMISSCTLFMNGLLQRYDSLSARLRALHIEHMELLRSLQQEHAANQCDPRETGSLCNLSKERLVELESEMPHLLKRHRLQWNAILAAEISIGLLVFSMFEIGFHVISHMPWVEPAALFTLLMGALVFLTCIMITAVEFATSPKAVTFEVKHGLELGR